MHYGRAESQVPEGYMDREEGYLVQYFRAISVLNGLLLVVLQVSVSGGSDFCCCRQIR